MEEGLVPQEDLRREPLPTTYLLEEATGTIITTVIVPVIMMRTKMERMTFSGSSSSAFLFLSQ